MSEIRKQPPQKRTRRGVITALTGLVGAGLVAAATRAAGLGLSDANNPKGLESAAAPPPTPANPDRGLPDSTPENQVPREIQAVKDLALSIIKIPFVHGDINLTGKAIGPYKRVDTFNEWLSESKIRTDSRYQQRSSMDTPGGMGSFRSPLGGDYTLRIEALLYEKEVAHMRFTGFVPNMTSFPVDEQDNPNNPANIRVDMDNIFEYAKDFNLGEIDTNWHVVKMPRYEGYKDWEQASTIFKRPDGVEGTILIDNYGHITIDLLQPELSKFY